MRFVASRAQSCRSTRSNASDQEDKKGNSDGSSVHRKSPFALIFYAVSVVGVALRGRKVEPRFTLTL